MPVIGFLLAAGGSALYGFLAGVGWLTIYALRGSPGSTGMEILLVPFLVTIATMAGTIAAAISLLLSRTSLRWSDSFVFLVVAAFAVQALASLVPFLIVQVRPHDMLLRMMSLSGPVDWIRQSPNWHWLYTVPLTLGFCSRWFRWRFEG